MDSKEWEITGKNVSISFSHKIYFNKPFFIRGLHKIAFEYIAFAKGKEHILASIFDDCRKFVLNGKPKKNILQFCGKNIGAFGETSIKCFIHDEIGNIIVPIKLLGIDFMAQVTNGADLIDKFHTMAPKFGQYANRW